MNCFFKLYLKCRIKGLLRSILYVAIFLLVFWLCRLPVSIVFYPALVCLFLALVFAIWDVCKCYKRYQTLLILCKQPSSCVERLLPEPSSEQEACYQSLIRALIQAEEQNSLDAREQYEDLMEYFTLWAHQIKTPLSAMSLSLQQEDSPLSRKLMGNVKATQRYVQMVLLYVKLKEGSLDYVIIRQSLDRILKNCIRHFAGEFIDRKLKLVYTPTELTVLTDEKWLGFVIEQLLSNALKYTPKGEVRIYRTGKCTLCIEDTGLGISPEDLPRIFEKGYTGQAGRQFLSASGIGLYLCKRITQSLGHSIWVESTVGQGSCFYLDLEEKMLETE